MLDATTSQRLPLQPYKKYLILFLALTNGSVWGLSIFYMINYDFAVSVLGDLDLGNPYVILALHSPAIAGFLIFYLYDGTRGIGNFFRSLVPRKQDVPWLLALALLMVGYLYGIRYLAMLFGIDVPPETQAPMQLVLTFLELFYMEVGMVAVAIGWFGFFLPLMHRVTKNHVTAGIATGVGIAVFVAPGNVFASFELAMAWPLYAAQLSVLCTGMSLLISKMKGNILFFLIPFWVSASGSAMQMYYFDVATQFVQLGLFATLVTVLYFVLKRQSPNGELDVRYRFPEYLENSYTTRMGSVFAGKGDKSQDIEAGPKSESDATDADAMARD